MILHKVYKFHNCSSRHRDGSSFMRCALRKAEWVHGRGTFAVIAWCSHVTVTVWPTEAEALDSKSEIDAAGCSGRCRRNHEVVRIELEQQMRGTRGGNTIR